MTDKLTSQGRLEDIRKALESIPLWNDYWEDKKADISRINVPVYAVASWTNPLHTPGTLNVWSMIPNGVPKWLRVHNTQEWSDYYTDSSRQDLKRSFDYYLHDRIDNGWSATPKVCLSVLNFGLRDLGGTVSRAEAYLPLLRMRHVHY
jgi:uncharacterized protein